MGLDNFPVRCECGKHTYRRGVPRGYTHRSDEACPFDGDDFVRGFFGNCCWLRGKVTSYELEALGNADLAGRMYTDMTAEEALAFAGELRQFADEQEKLFSGEGPKPRGCKWTELKIDASGKATTVDEHTTFENAIATIRNAADWYEKTSRLGFGVRAWA
jgi:hypothetical protein